MKSETRGETTMINDINLSETYDLKYETLLELRENHPKVYAALHDALKLNTLREILGTGATDHMAGESVVKSSNEEAIPDIHDRRSAKR